MRKDERKKRIDDEVTSYLIEKARKKIENKFGKKKKFSDESCYGLYDPSSYTITLRNELSELETYLVYLHEDMHHRLGLLNYGEAIRRLNTLSLILFIRLNRIRVEYCHSSLDEILGRKHEFFELHYIQTNKEVQKRIRERMVTDEVFINGVRFLNEIEQKQIILHSEWDIFQEGFAYWISYRFLLKHLKEKQDITSEKKLSKIMKRIDQFPERVQQGIKLVQALEKNWGFDNMYQCQYICGNPSFKGLSILNNDLNEFMTQIASSIHSPNFRLKKMVEISFTEPYSSITDLFKRFSPSYKDNLTHLLEFNNYWQNNVNENNRTMKVLTPLFNRLNERWNPDDLITKPEKYQQNEGVAPRVTYGNDDILPKLKLPLDSDGNEGDETEEKEDYSRLLEILSVQKRSFLSMAKREKMI